MTGRARLTAVVAAAALTVGGAGAAAAAPEDPLGAAPEAAALAARGVPRVVGVDAVVQVGPLGAAVTAVAVEHDRPLSVRSGTPDGTLDRTKVDVDVTLGDATSTRTVTGVYVSSSAEPGAPRRSGRFLVVTLEPGDANAGVLTYDGELNHPLDLDGAYTVDVRDDLVDRSGRVVVRATGDALVNDGVVTPVVDDFAPRSATGSSGVRLRYGLFSPDVDRAAGARYPLVVALHGAGERGTDGRTPLLSNELGVAFAKPSRQRTDPGFVLVPQAPPPSVQPVGDWVGVWDVPEVQSALLELIDRTIATHPVDPDRVYVTGLSMGSMGTYQVLAERPDLFAAALPVTGYADPRFASVFAAVPTWATHSVDDEAVPFFHPYSDWSLLTAIEATGAVVTRDEWAANLPDAENEARARAQWDRATAAGSRTLFTAWTAGTTPVNGHFAWVPTYSNDVMVDWLYSHERE